MACLFQRTKFLASYHLNTATQSLRRVRVTAPMLCQLRIEIDSRTNIVAPI